MDRQPPGHSIRGAADPRSTDPRKRGPSRSPDYAQARKHHKPDTPLENGIPHSNTDSRRSSISNGASNGPRPNLVAPSVPSAPSVQPQKAPPVAPMRRQSDGAALSSPRSPTATSGRSTPQQRPSNLSKDTTGQLSNDVATPAMDLSNLDSMSLTDLLVKFSSDLASRAALEHEKSQAQAALLSAQNEYGEMKKHFKSYPAIEERKSKDKKAAQEALKAKEKQLLEHATSQQTIAGALASIITQLATPKPNPDMVSRAEFDALQRELKEQRANTSRLREDLNAAKSIAERANTIADRANSQSGQVPKFYSDIESLKKDTILLVNWKKDAEGRFNGLANYGQRLAGVEEKSTNTKKAFDNFMEQTRDKLAFQQDVNKLQSRVDELSKSHAKATADKMKSAQSIWSDEKLQALQDEQAEHASNIKDLQLGGNQIFVEVKATLDKAVKEQDTMSQTLAYLGTDVVTSKKEINAIHDAITEEGKDVIVKRVKKLDMLVNNLFSKVGDSDDASTTKRLSQLEKDCKALKDAARTTAASNTPSIPSTSTIATPVNTGPLETRLDTLQHELNSFISQQNEKDELVEEEIKDVATTQAEAVSNKLSTEISSLRAENNKSKQKNESAVQALTNDYQSLKTALDGFEETLRSKSSTDAVETLQASVTTISEEVKKVKFSQERARSVSQAPTVGNQANQANGSFPGQQQSPQLANGIAGSPQLNGASFRPHSPYAGQHQAQNIIAPHALQDVQARIDGLIYVTQQLKMRCDNLQTDDVVRAMLDQFHAIYPDARNINATVSTLRNNISSIQQQLSVLQQQQKKSPTAEYSGEDVKKAIAKADGASKSAMDVSENLQKIKTEINTIKEAVKTLENKPASGNASVDSAVTKQMSSLRTDIDAATVTANDADRLSKQHASRLSKILPEELKKRVATLEGTVDEHTRDISTGREALKKLNDVQTSQQGEIEHVKKVSATNRTSIEKLKSEQN